jgi:hypothetical protein
MLRVSAQKTGTEVDVRGIDGDPEAADTGIEHGRELTAFAEAFAARDEAGLARARDILQTCGGNSVVVDAAGAAANFQRVVRIADATGIPIDNPVNPLRLEIRQTLDLAPFPR